MSRTGITYEEVVEAAFFLLNNNINPTIDGVRQTLGNRGSNTTISKHLKEWRFIESRDSASKNSVLSATPQSLNSLYMQGYRKAIDDILQAAQIIKIRSSK